MFASILAPLDGSAESEAALTALAHVGLRPEQLILLHVVHPLETVIPALFDNLADWPPATGPIRSAQAYLDSVRDRLAVEFPDCVTEVVEGDPRVQILAAARRHGASLIALTADAGGAPGRFVFGSLAGRIAGVSPAHVLVAPRGRAERMATERIGRVIVPLDGSTSSEDPLPMAAAVARML
ncbi:MAG: universal stress protein, partial [Thermomicrobiales bacterium]